MSTDDEPVTPTDGVIDLAVNCICLGVAVGALVCATYSGWRFTQTTMAIVVWVTLRNLWKLTRHWWVRG